MPTDVTAIDGWTLVGGRFAGAPVPALGGEAEEGLVGDRPVAGEGAARNGSARDGRRLDDRHGGVDDALPDLGSSPILRRFSAFGCLTRVESAYLAHLDERPFPARTDIVVEGEVYARAFLLKAGWAFRYKLLADGRRQILNLLIPGDVVGPYSHRADHSVAALTEACAVQFSPRGIEERASEFPHVAATITWAMAREYEMLAERAVSLGRRTAYERVAYLIAELLVRLQAIGLGDEQSFPFPVTQEIMADALGLSVVHVNRTLRRLRQDNVITFRDRRVLVRTLDGLAEAAALDGGLPDCLNGWQAVVG